MATTTRHLGYCPCCAKEFKVRGGQLVHHGYKRPGYGFIEGDCYGALRVPHELSPELAQDYLGMIERLLASDEKALAELPEVTKFKKTVARRVKGRTVREIVEVPKAVRPEGGYDWDGDREGALAQAKAVEAWDRAYASRERYLKGSIQALRNDVKRLTELVDTWELKALRSVEEEQAQQRAAKAEREAAKVAKKAAKLDTQVAKFQKRIDSALRTKNSNVLAEVWESIQSKLRDIDSSLTKAECLSLVERDEVWEAFGLAGLTVSPWSAKRIDQPEREALSLMKGRMDRLNGCTYLGNGRDAEWTRNRVAELSLEWPASLGGENKKGAKTLAEIREMQAG
jgi:hypothetical protein